MKRIALEQGLYAQVVMICRKQSYNKKGNEKTNKYNFPGQSAGSIRWFDLDHERLEENCSTHEPGFYKKFIKQILGFKRQKHIRYLYSQLIM